MLSLGLGHTGSIYMSIQQTRVRAQLREVLADCFRPTHQLIPLFLHLSSGQGDHPEESPRLMIAMPLAAIAQADLVHLTQDCHGPCVVSPRGPPAYQDLDACMRKVHAHTRECVRMQTRRSQGHPLHRKS